MHHKMTLVVIIISCVLLQALNAQIPFNNYNPRELIDTLPGYGKTWMYFPDGSGIPHVARLHASPAMYKSQSDTEKYITFNLYTRENKNESQKLQLGDVQNLQSSHIDLTKETKFMVHGWMSSEKKIGSQVIKDNFLETRDCNVILVDWNTIAGNIIYPIPMMESRNVGRHIAKFVDYLVNNGARLEDIHLIGHSLGAHVVGVAGSEVQSGKISRITGLDPAMPGFEITAGVENRLDPADALFVDVIHTCGGVLGYFSALGHADFYPNGGTPSQPGCFGLPQIIEACSHGRAWKYFAESILDNDAFLATECNTWKEFFHGECTNNSIIPMGITAPNTARGIYYLKTDSKPPYAINMFNDFFDLKRKRLKIFGLDLF